MLMAQTFLKASRIVWKRLCRSFATATVPITTPIPSQALLPCTAPPAIEQLRQNGTTVPLESSYSRLQLFTKSSIPLVLGRYAPQLNVQHYRAAAEVFPMRTNQYVLENHIDWKNVPNDPMFQLLFPQPEMLPPEDLQCISQELENPGNTRVKLRNLAESIRARMNPHPAGQKEENVPVVDGQEVEGMQHKYQETVLFFPMEGQFCQSFCTYCFRWAQFTSVGSNQQFKSASPSSLAEYLSQHPNVTDVLFTGGDPMVMSTDNIAKYILPILPLPTPRSSPANNLRTIRIGTKSLSFWPSRYISDPDATALLNLFSRITSSGLHLTIQAHFSHPRELATPQVREAIRLIRMTGANIRTQSPLVRHVNDDPEIWREMWNLQVGLGAVPYYMFVERDTGANHYFSVPLERAHRIFSSAYSRVSGLARTVRGPSMSASPGKVLVLGVEIVKGEKAFVLKFTQARDPSWSGRVFFAGFDPNASWLTDLRPAFGARRFFFEADYERIREETKSSGQLDFA